MIIARDLNLSFGPQTVLKDGSFTINKEQRVGLVGRNGSGKSTLLSLIAGLQKSDSGILSINKQYTIAYMPQDVVLASDKSILAETITAFGDLHILQQELNELEQKIEQEQYEQTLLDRYQELHVKLNDLKPERVQAEAEKMLFGLGFSQKQLSQPVSTLSVGWKMRIVLAKLLLQKADFYLLDEPTNHLDIVAKDWFLNLLKTSDFGFLLVCHERFFLDQLCDHILELELGNATMYTGGYTEYEKQKERNAIRLQQEYEEQQKEIKRKEETINRFRASANKSKMAQSMLKQLDKIERIELPPSPKTVNFAFPPVARAGKIVLKVHNIGYTFDGKKVFDKASFMLERGQKAALVAPNGGGKTTLFNCIAGKLPLQQGSVAFGHNVTYALFDQDQNKSLNLEKNIYENISEACPNVNTLTIRTFLGSFLFNNDDIQKKVGVLSGGEKNRVGMVKTLLQNANLLLLDEPTNHLDIPSKEILLKALQNYEGSILFVSHDHDFINHLATEIIELTPHGTFMYPGTYSDYLYAKQEQQNGAVRLDLTQSSASFARGPHASRVRSSAGCIEGFSQPSQKVSLDRHTLNKKSNALERKIDKLEQEMHTISERLATLQYGQNGYADVVQKLQNLQKERDECLLEWESIQAEL